MIGLSSTIIVPSLVLLPQSAQFGYFFAPYGWTIVRSVCLEELIKVARDSFAGRAQTGFQFTRETQKRNKQKWRRALVWI